MKPNGLLKVVSILFIIFGAISLIVAIAGIAGASILIAAGAGAFGAILILTIILSFAGAILEFIGGIPVSYTHLGRHDFFDDDVRQRRGSCH